MDPSPPQDLPALEASEARFRTLIQKNADGILVVRLDGVVRLINPAAEALLGRPASAVIGETFGVPLVPGEPTEVDILRGNGQGSAVAEMRVVEMTWEGERVYLASLRDITDRRRLEEQLRQRAEQLAEADRRKDEFLAMLAHELRNPLGPIRNALHLLARPGAGEETVQKARTIAERQVAHMARLIDDLLDVSRVTCGKIRLAKEPVDLKALVNRVVDAARPGMESRRQHFTVELPSCPIQLEADATRLEQVLTNLLHNAGKFTDSGGHIGLSVHVHPADVEIRVRDNGMGIAADMLPHIFDLFTQGDRSLERSQGGLGIGLTLAKRLVEMHGGRIKARSAGPGHGSEFAVWLPALREGAPAEQPVPGVQASEACGPRKPKRILIVEDQLDAAEMLASLLRLDGHEVRAAHDGPSALEAAREYQPEVVFLDIGLPGMSGYQVARHLREHAGENRMRIVALTGYGREEDRHRSHEAGCDRHLVKPVDPITLQHLLAEFSQAEGHTLDRDRLGK
jgi:signal transduction histidine kinase/ActR/RegA family two-component response regulator